MDTRIATLNIRQGGTRSAEALTDRMLGYDADLLVVTEFRANAAGTALFPDWVRPAIPRRTRASTVARTPSS